MTIPFRYLAPAATAVVLTVVAGVAMVRGAEVASALEVVEAWARATPPGAEVGAAYVTLRNNGPDADSLVGATSSVAARIETHETTEANGVARMRPTEAPTIPAGGELAMRPGGTHLMLMGLAAPLTEGDRVPLTLTFAKAGTLTIEVDVAPLGADAPAGDGHSM